jgi:hypothetical protein
VGVVILSLRCEDGDGDVDVRGELGCSGLAVADTRMAGNSEVALSFARASFGFDFTHSVSRRLILTSLHL